jgi:hypothetical protein
LPGLRLERLNGGIEAPLCVPPPAGDLLPEARSRLTSRRQRLDRLGADDGLDPLDPRERRHRDMRWEGRGAANDGEPYENSHAWIMRLAGEKVIDGTAFY